MSQVTVRRPLCDSSWATGYGRSQRHFSISSFVSPQRERRFSVVDRSGVTLSYSFDQRLRKWERRFYHFQRSLLLPDISVPPGTILWIEGLLPSGAFQEQSNS
jgi:hypothetical protein